MADSAEDERTKGLVLDFPASVLANIPGRKDLPNMVIVGDRKGKIAILALTVIEAQPRLFDGGFPVYRVASPRAELRIPIAPDLFGSTFSFARVPIAKVAIDSWELACGFSLFPECWVVAGKVERAKSS